MPLQSAFDRLLISSSCYPFGRRGKAEISWRATPPELCIGYEGDRPEEGESAVIATYASLHSCFRWDVRRNSSQVCNRESSGAKLQYRAESATPPGIHVAVETQRHEQRQAVSPGDKRRGSILSVSGMVRNAFCVSGYRPRGAGRARSISGDTILYPVRPTPSAHPESRRGKQSQKGYLAGAY
jgi:hypothetical protein